MRPLLCGSIVFLLCIAILRAELVVNTIAGGRIPSGVPAQDVPVGTIGGVTIDPAGNIVFSESSRHVIRRIRTDGMIETIAGTGISGFDGDGSPATGAALNFP